MFVSAYSYEYGYDKVGNRTSLSIEAVDAATEISMDWRFEYDWNPRDQMERVDKFVNGAAIPVGYVV